jgi:mannose-6-phosphate isomerase-like protein (cupin superfamily)
MLPNSNVTYELLSPLNRQMEMLLVKIEPGECSHDTLMVHEGEECGYVLQGTMQIKYGAVEYTLQEGDSIYLDSTVPHRYINTGSITAVSIWTMTPPSY